MMNDVRSVDGVRAGWNVHQLVVVSGGVLLLLMQGCAPEGGGSRSPSGPELQKSVILDSIPEDTGQEPPVLNHLQLCSEEYVESMGVRLCVYKTDCDDPDADGWWDFGCDGFDLTSPGNPGAQRPDFTLCHEGVIDGRRACIYQSDCDELGPREFQIDFECDGEDFVRAVTRVVRSDVAPIDFGNRIEYDYNQFSGSITMDFEPKETHPVVLPRGGDLRIWQLRSSDGTYEMVELKSGDLEAGALIRVKGTMTDYAHWMHAMGIPHIEFEARGVVFVITRPSVLPMYEIRMDGLVIEEVQVNKRAPGTLEATAGNEP